MRLNDGIVEKKGTLIDFGISSQELSNKYRQYCRPKLGQILQALRLDKSYHRAEGDLMYYFDDMENEVEVVDFIGGYGSSMFGHNNPVLLNRAISNLQNNLPFSSQASCRWNTALCCEKLNNMMFKYTKKNYVVTLANTGTEAVEAAIKHAEMRRMKKIDKLQKDLKKELITLQEKYENNELRISNDFYNNLHSKLDIPLKSEIKTFFNAIIAYNYTKFKTPPVFLSLKGSFHGKTSGSVQLTYNEDFRIPFLNIGPKVKFLDFENNANLLEAIEDSKITYVWPVINNKNEITVDLREHIYIAAMIIEPLQGEGGINSIPSEFLKFSRKITSDYEIPLIFDEIQCGMGRTGTFLYSQQQQIVADYYLLSKSLGGGLSKIAALLINEDDYDNDFGMIHTSTFAEDEFSSSIALEALDLLDRNPVLMENCRKREKQIKNGIRAIQNDYPGVIDDIRGAGLMLGIQFSSQEKSGSVLLRVLSEQGLIVMVIAGYLMHEHLLRVVPALSNNSLMRIEPSAYIDSNNCDRLLSALRKACEAIYKQNIYELTKFIVGAESPGSYNEIIDLRRDYCPYNKPLNARKIAFMGHFIDDEGMVLYEKGFRHFTKEQRCNYIDRVYKIIGPMHAQQVTVESKTGEMTSLNFIGLFLDSRLISKKMQDGDVAEIHDKVEEAVEMAISLGCKVIGFGGYSSIVTRNCTNIVTDEIALTTGNSLTVAMGIEAIYKAADDFGIDTSKACFAAIGANGNICSIYSEIIAEIVPRIILIARQGKEKRLRSIASDIYHSAFLAVKSHFSGKTNCELKGVAKAIRDTDSVKYLLDQETETENIGMWLLESLDKEMKEKAPIVSTSDYRYLKEADLIVGASNSPEPVISQEMLGSHPIVICDIAVPPDVDESVKKMRNDVKVIQGGLVSIPNDPYYKIDGIPLDSGQAYACMSETITMGLTGISEHFSYGRISKIKVKQIMEIAKGHGMRLARFKTNNSY